MSGSELDGAATSIYDFREVEGAKKKVDKAKSEFDKIKEGAERQAAFSSLETTHKEFENLLNELGNKRETRILNYLLPYTNGTDRFLHLSSRSSMGILQDGMEDLQQSQAESGRNLFLLEE